MYKSISGGGVENGLPLNTVIVNFYLCEMEAKVKKKILNLVIISRYQINIILEN